jgi:DNA-binding transcriptional ArsR family regulator
MRSRKVPKHAIFAALGDATRLALVSKLSASQSRSISQLTEGSALTRQAITKHLEVLERVKMVHKIRAGRESLFQFDPEPLEDAKKYLALVSAEWDQTLGRLKAFVEK